MAVSTSAQTPRQNPGGSAQRVSFAKLREPLEVPNLLALQTESFDWLVGAQAWRDRQTEPTPSGLDEILTEISPIEDFSGNLSLTFSDPWFDEVKASEDDCREKDTTYAAPLFVTAEFMNAETGEIKSQTVFMGDFPIMTKKGTFIINGTERVVVSQLVRSPGVYFDKNLDKTAGKDVFSVKVIPSRGAWLEFDIDKRDTIGVRIDRKRRQPVTVLLKALGWDESQIREKFAWSEVLLSTLEKDHIPGQDEALLDIYRKLRPGEPPTRESAENLLQNLFFRDKRYDLAKVGRYKLNKKLGLAEPTSVGVLTEADLVSVIEYLLRLHDGQETWDVRGQTLPVETDDIDHFGNRRLRTVGELIQNQVRVGLSRMERVVRERMTTQDVEAITPQTLINIRPVVASIREFFGTSQLSQFMDQVNPLAGLTHKRRMSALGPGGLSRDRASLEVRDVHPSHYGRMCPIETPEGPNIGLIGSLATFARVNPFGFIETPYRKVTDGIASEDIVYLTADEEDRFIIAQASAKLDANGKLTEDRVFVRRKSQRASGEVDQVDPSEVQYMDVSPRQTVSVATAMIPFLEHDEANRALMGANMQRQSVPLLRSESPLVGTGMEYRAAVDAGDVVIADEAGVVEEATADYVSIMTDGGQHKTFRLRKFRRSNQGTSFNQRPIVVEGQRVEANQVIADGPCTQDGEMALGKNLLVAFMPWEGHNYEDAIILSQRIVQDDVLTSIHIEEHEIDARDTKLGPEEITRDIPNVSDEVLADLDERGIIRIGAEVQDGDILVGKVTPKGETELTPEERLLRAIFGEKAREVRDTSLKVPHGETGKVIGVQVFTRDDDDAELSAGVNELVRVYVAQKRKIQDGDKLAGRHGNKGVIGKILPVEDMPFLADGTPVDIILNPHGVPRRMNIGQILETHLGWVAARGWKIEGEPEWAERIEAREAGPFTRTATPVFDGATEDEITGLLDSTTPTRDGDRLVGVDGKAPLYDGRSGEPFPYPVAVGYMYILKLSHLVDDKIHARSTGPYSMITQQPLGGKAQFGGQRFGEMECWAMQAYGAAYTLQELLTIKSDDIVGRVKVYEAIVKGDNIPEPGIPESFKVLLKELQALCLNVEVLASDGAKIEMRDSDDDDLERAAANLGINLSRNESASVDDLVN